jgi:hypothetical protein
LTNPAAASLLSFSGVVLQYNFLPGYPLHPLKHELLLWASWRGQLLARTVRGLMSYRAALQALAAHENPHLMPAETQQQYDRLQESTHALRNRQEQLQQQLRALQAADRDSQAGGGRESTPGQQHQQYQQHRRQEAERVAGKVATVQRRLQADAAQLQPLQQQHQQWEALRGVLLDDLVDGKYHLVVSSQMFGVFASQESSSNMKARWLVHSIHMLRQQHPTLKVSGWQHQLHRFSVVCHFWCIQAQSPLVCSGFPPSPVYSNFSQLRPAVVSSWSPMFSDSSKDLLYCTVLCCAGCLAFLQVAYIDKQLLASASVPGRKVELFRNASVLLASSQQEKLAAAAGLQQPREAFRCACKIHTHLHKCTDRLTAVVAVSVTVAAGAGWGLLLLHAVCCTDCVPRSACVSTCSHACPSHTQKLVAALPACLPAWVQGAAAGQL